MMANAVDIQMGFLVRERRILLGITQTDLATMLGVSCQQVQKYETGQSSISCVQLLDIATILDTNIHYFFDNIPISHTKSMQDKALDREILEIIKSYRTILNKAHRRVVATVCHTIADAQTH